eukprot:scaffold193941_cov17-Tisochrysis_lutea.AAC.1
MGGPCVLQEREEEEEDRQDKADKEGGAGEGEAGHDSSGIHPTPTSYRQPPEGLEQVSKEST